MHIKKFEAKDLPEALERIREELGPDAVILETSHAPRPRKGVTVLAAMPRDAGDYAEPGESPAGAASAAAPGAFRRPMPARLETAGPARSLFGSGSGATNLGGSPIRPFVPPVVPRSPLAFGATFGVPPGSREATERRAEAPSREPLVSRPSAPAPAAVPFPTIASARQQEAEEEARTLRARVEHLNKLVRSDHFSAVPIPLRQLYFELTEAEVDADLVFRILEKMGSAPIQGQFTPAPPGELLAYLRSLVRIGGTVEAGERKVLALVGPTGVGKTTTLAKIAGDACFRRGLSVALVSSDAYRVFGAQHLAAYAALMGLPFYAAGSAREMQALFARQLQGTDLVLVDTSGRSPNDAGGINEIQQILAACPELDVHLALSANTRARDLALALDAYSVLPVQHLLFTKLDEATSRGGLFTTALKSRRPVSWLGTGQEVPDDLEAATAAALTHGLLEDPSHDGPGR